MNFLLIAPDLGFTPSGDISPGGLQNFGRCVARVLASTDRIDRLDVWTQTDAPATHTLIRRMLDVYTHPYLALDVRGFEGSRRKLAWALVQSCVRKTYDYVMYLLVNQSVMTFLPWHPPYAVWEIGREMFVPLPWYQRRALARATNLLSISKNTSKQAQHYNPGLPAARVVHLCKEPPLFAPPSDADSIATETGSPELGAHAVFILSRISKGSLDKGHQELIAGWPLVVEQMPHAELWIGGKGNGLPELQEMASHLPKWAAQQIHFLGYLDDAELHERFQRCRVFAMPSRREGFGLVFVEAARYGKPCIGSVHDSVKEIVLHNETGLLVKQEPKAIAQACIKLLQDDDLARRLGHAARQRYFDYFQFQHFRERLLTAIGLDCEAL